MRVNDGRVIPTFISQALRNQDITVFGNGTQTRSFCFVTDTVAGFKMMMASDYNEPKNIGNPREITIMELAQLIIKRTGSKSNIIHHPMPPDDPTKRRPDISKARKMLGWNPKIPLEEGLEPTIEWIKDELKKD